MSDSDRQPTGWVDDLLFHAQGEARYAKRCKAILRQCGVPGDAIPSDLEGILAEFGLGGLEFEDDREFEVALKTRARAWVREERRADAAAMKAVAPAGKPVAENAVVITPEAEAILFIQERLKTTGKLPTKKAIADLLEVHPRTLLNWRAFTAAYGELERKHGSPRRRPRGEKSGDGTLEAWQD